MEVIKNNNGRNDRYLYLGVVLIAAGLVWLLKNTDVISYSLFDIIFSWEVMMVLIGGYLLLQERYFVGMLLTVVGLIFLFANILNLSVMFNKIALPVVVMTIGVSFLMKVLAKK